MSGTGAAVSVGTPGLRAAGCRLVPIVVFGIVPIAVVCLLLAESVGVGSRLSFWDFHALWNAGRDVLHGASPYPPATRAALGGQQAFVYPAPAAVAAVPFALLPFTAASVTFELVSIAAVLLALWVVGVRDWRCYGLAFLSRPVLHGLSLGAVTPLLTLGLAITWRWRDRRWIAGGAVAALIVLKVFLWPMLLWLAFTRRNAAARSSPSRSRRDDRSSVGRVIGFDGLRTYPHLLNLLSRVLEGRSYSVTALGLVTRCGSDRGAERSRGCRASPAWSLIAMRGGGARIGRLDVHGGGRRGARPLADRLAPLLHPALVPLAIVSPRLGWLWITPLAFWVVGGQSTDPSVWERGRTSARGLDTASIGSPAIIGYAVLVATVLLAVLTSRAGRIDN